MLGEWELWACANQVMTTQGDKATLDVAEQIGALALVWDDDGIRIWQTIASRIAKLSDENGPPARQ